MKGQADGGKRLRRMWLLTSLLAVTAFAPAGNVVAHEQVNGQPEMDAMVINTMDDRVLAARAGAAPRDIELSFGEQIKSSQTSGLVGSVVTSERMLAISSTSLEWISIPLDIGEDPAASHLSENLVLFVTLQRAVLFDGSENRLLSFDIPLGETVVEQSVLPAAAAFATMDRAVAYASGAPGFEEFLFLPEETFQHLDVSEGLFSITTSERILLFSAASGQWNEQSFP